MKHVSKPRKMPYTALNSVILLYLIDLKKKKSKSVQSEFCILGCAKDHSLQAEPHGLKTPRLHNY